MDNGTGCLYYSTERLWSRVDIVDDIRMVGEFRLHVIFFEMINVISTGFGTDTSLTKS